MARLASFLCCLVVWLSSVASAGESLLERLPNDWFVRAPTPERLQSVQRIAESEGWGAVSTRVLDGAVRAYELRHEDAAAAWLLVARWGDVLGRTQAEAARRWLEALSARGALYAHIDQAWAGAQPDEPMAQLLTPGFTAWLLKDRSFSEAFFNQVSAVDCLPRVLTILAELHAADSARFVGYAQLALAIALVHDTPPPAHWPHWQVKTEVLPRRLPDASALFKFLVDADRAGMTLHKLGSLSVAELRFVTDVAVALPELAWAQRNVKFSLAELAKSYEAVLYRRDRIEANEYIWPGVSYKLEEILREGGICVDQAYFATQAAKARGVPTLLIAGAGRDGRHAWFGYLGNSQKWHLDAGRYEEQRYVTGVTLDPQTWLALSDHELVFLSEGFRRLPPFRQSLQHQAFAELYLRRGNQTAATAAARKAVNQERRNVDAWELLVAAGGEAPPRERESLLREAALALQRYPDLNASFVRRIAASMRERGETSAAEFEERSLVRRGQAKGRSDLGVEHAAGLMEATRAPADRMRVYKRLLQQYGQGAGIDFFDRVTRPLVERLVDEDRRGEALQVIALTRAALKPEIGSQFDREMDDLTANAK